MSKPPPVSTRERIWGYAAEFTSPAAITSAAKKVAAAGYRWWDCHTPFPVHGLDIAMGVKPTILPILVFFGGDGDPNGYTTRGLLDIPGWEAMSYAEAAQAVQISAYPDRYARWEQPAYAWLAAHG